ncbi:MAG: prepilin-type N-terminal cleavage/methylation domain-containing protein [Candidatus Saccharibacteria bacterium]|jgi:prepilin-type N-terminal cleavage/methylation domain-containing protein|nr:MAG: prepilin-type N-terminal cleavage/methylation domain-containing protein [Candidatus Saccharibacteria bacterium]
MTLSNIKTMKKDRGFTIVELLIVIVVIAILAAITIVAYSGITARANTTKAQTNAVAVQKVAEAYNADTGRYPGLTGDFTTGSTSTKLPSGVTVVPQSTALTSTSGTTTVTWAYVGTSATTATGGRITYWDFTTGAVSTTIIYVGNATSGSTFTNPAS